MSDQIETQVSAVPPDQLKSQFDTLWAEQRYSDLFDLACGLVAQNPNNGAVWLEYGRILSLFNKLDEALVCFRHVLTLDPDFVLARVVYGHCVLKINGDAIGCPIFSNLDFWDKTVTDTTKVDLFNLGAMFITQGYYEDAEICFRLYLRHSSEDLKFSTDYRNAQYNLATSLLYRGMFKEAAPHMVEWIAESASWYNFTVWRGESLAGKNLYLFADNGLGDVIFSLRYLPIIAPMCKSVTLLIAQDLRCFLPNIPNLFVVSTRPSLCDYYSTLFILPHVLGIDLDRIPATVPYIPSDRSLTALWRSRLPQSGFRVGIGWQAGTPTPPGRSMPLVHYAPLAQIPNVQLVSLQACDGLDQLENMPEGMSLQTLGPEYGQRFADTAAVMQNLDVIITIDTSLAHLAGALGRPVWMLLKRHADCRWMIDRDDCPWYPTMRLFRQTTDGDWDEVIARVVHELAKIIPV